MMSVSGAGNGYAVVMHRLVALSAAVPSTSTLRMYPVDGQLSRTRITRLEETAFNRASCISRSTSRADSFSLMLAVMSFMTGRAMTDSVEIAATTISISETVKPRWLRKPENIGNTLLSNRAATIAYVAERLGVSGYF